MNIGDSWDDNEFICEQIKNVMKIKYVFVQKDVIIIKQ